MSVQSCQHYKQDITIYGPVGRIYNIVFEKSKTCGFGKGTVTYVTFFGTHTRSCNDKLHCNIDRKSFIKTRLLITGKGHSVHFI